MRKIMANDTIVYKPEWSDEGDSKILFKAVEDQYEDRVMIVAMIGLGAFNPIQIVLLSMIERSFK